MKKIAILTLSALLLIIISALTTYRLIMKTMSVEVVNNQAIITVAGQSDVYDIR